MLKLNLEIYRKLFLSSSLTFIVSVSGIFVIISYNYFQSQIRNDSELSRKKMTEITENLRYDVLSIDNTVYSLYEIPQMLSDTLNYLRLDAEEYYSYRLSYVSQQTYSYYQSHETFVQNIFNRNQRVSGVGLYSYNKDSMTTFKAQGSSVVISNIKQKKINNQIDKMIIDRYEYSQKYAMPLIYSIKDGSELLGELVIFQNLDFIDTILARYQQPLKKVELTGPNQIIYDSTRTQAFLSSNNTNNSEDSSTQNYPIKIGAETFTLSEKTVGWQFLSYVGKEYIYICMAVAMILLSGVYVIWRRMKQAEERLESILSGIDEIEAGNLDARIMMADDYNDELTIIANRLNIMHSELRQRIQEQYLTEINQQQAELAFLQSQINPHFLYNTLETIRMKAIIEGNREVGKLIFSLATLFRQTYQKSRIITIREEIELIETYLSLFMNRYPDTFTYTVTCEQKLEQEQIVKFILQPIIENYFVHGIDYSHKNNQMAIEIITSGDKIKLVISDNGSGMSQDGIDELNNKIMNAKIYELEQSIALVNINKRLELTYGEAYKFEFYQNYMGGLSAAITIPKLEKKGENENVEISNY